MHIALQFCDLAMSAAAHLPPAERADLFEFAGQVLHARDLPEAAHAASRAAAALREAESAQLTFKRLLVIPSN